MLTDPAGRPAQIRPIPSAEDMGDDWRDNVQRLEDFRRAHPHVTVTSPKDSGTLGWTATWTEAVPGKRDGETEQKSNNDLGRFLDYLEARFRPAPLPTVAALRREAAE